MKKHVISFLGIALSHCQQQRVHFVTICVSQKGNDVHEKYLTYVIQLWKCCKDRINLTIHFTTNPTHSTSYKGHHTNLRRPSEGIVKGERVQNSEFEFWSDIRVGDLPAKSDQLGLRNDEENASRSSIRQGAQGHQKLKVRGSDMLTRHVHGQNKPEGPTMGRIRESLEFGWCRMVQ